MAAPQRQIVLCFDGTGNTFRTDGTDTNVLKICRMLERTDEQLCYYQPGIGTDITPGSLASSATFQKSHRHGNSKALNLALGKSFDRHVLGGYRFLMRHYRAGTRIYIFGFSRGAYVARFLNEMLDYSGLLGPDNEEVLPFVWDSFAAWKLSRNNDREEKRNAFRVLKECRETLSRPIERVHFLGLFDAVNSVADFEVNVDHLPSSRIVRHAVSIDERRVKFRPVLLRSNTAGWRLRLSRVGRTESKSIEEKRTGNHSHHRAFAANTPGPSDTSEQIKVNVPDDDQSAEIDDDDEDLQDAEEVWFPGGHADIGGGWDQEEDKPWSLSHAPLVWMVQEARRAGLRLVDGKLKQFRCIADDGWTEASAPETSAAPTNCYLNALHVAGTEGRVHDLLKYGHGMKFISVLSWRLMEYLPLRRMDIQPDGAWEPVRWPPPRGAVRDIPLDARIHVSAIQRMKADSSYRPANLTWPRQDADADGDGAGIGHWVLSDHEGDPVRETYIRERK